MDGPALHGVPGARAVTRSTGRGYGRKGLPRAPSLVGARYGRLVVIARDCAPGEAPNVYWACRCDCGAHVVARGTGLRSGETRACSRPCARSSGETPADLPQRGLHRHTAVFSGS